MVLPATIPAMRCPHCSGEIPAGSHFCGICGGHVTAAQRESRQAAEQSAPLPPPYSGESGSLFDLPLEGSGRRGRIALVLILDLILAAAGIAMIWSYVSARDRATANAEPTAAIATEKKTVESTAPEPPTGPTKSNVIPTTDGVAEPPDTGAANKTPAVPRDRKPPKRVKKPPNGNGGSGSGSAGNGGGGSGNGTGSGGGNGSGGNDTGSGGGGNSTGGGTGGGSGSADPEPGEPSEEEVSVFAGRIGGVVARNKGSLSRCYQRAAKTTSPDQPLAGRIDVRFRIMPDESVQRVRAVANTTNSDVLANCLVNHVKGWRFPNGPSSQLDFVWPFRFRAE